MRERDFEKDCIAFVYTFGVMCGLKPEACGPLYERMAPQFRRLREEWVAELDTVLAHAMRDRDTYKATLDEAQDAGSKLVYRVQAQVIAIESARESLRRALEADDDETATKAAREAYTVLTAAGVR
jgi:hypothetical protein